MAKTAKAKRVGALKKSTIEKAPAASLRKLAKGRVKNPIGKKVEEVRQLLLDWADEHPPANPEPTKAD